MTSGVAVLFREECGGDADPGTPGHGAGRGKLGRLSALNISPQASPAAAGPIANPFFFQIERSDTFDASVGIRWQFADNAVLSANALVPLNRQGLQANVIPTVEIECTF